MVHVSDATADGWSMYKILFEPNKTYHELHQEYAIKNDPLKQVATFWRVDGSFFTRTRVDPGKRFTSDGTQSDYYPVRWNDGGGDETICVITEGEKAGVALISNPSINAIYRIYSVGPVWGFKKADFSQFEGKRVILWPDNNTDCEPEGVQDFLNNLAENRIKPEYVKIVSHPLKGADAADYLARYQEEYLYNATEVPVVAQRVSQQKTFVENETPSEMLSYLMQVPAPKDRETWIRFLAAAKASGITMEEAKSWSARDTEKFREQDWPACWNGLKGTTQATLLHLVEEYGVTTTRQKFDNENQNRKQRSDQRRERKEYRDSKKANNWIFSSNIRADRNSKQNVLNALDELNMMHHFAYNEWTRTIEYHGEEITDEDIVHLGSLFENAYSQISWTPGSQVIYDSVTVAAHEQTYNPVKEYLERCRMEYISKGRPSLLSSLAENAFAQREEDFDDIDEFILANEIAALIVRGQVVRALHPGAEFQYMPVLKSKQGTGKGQSLKILAIHRHVEGLDLGGFDSQKKIQERTRGASIVEVAEFSSLRHTELDKLKAATSDTESTNREAFGRIAVTRKYTHIMVATTNKDQMFTDEEHRRNPVIEIPDGREINLAYLQQHKDLLLGEAAEEFSTGMFWEPAIKNHAVKLPRELWKLANQVSQKYEVQQPVDVMLMERWGEIIERGDPILSSALWDSVAEYKSQFGTNAIVRAMMQKHGYVAGRRKVAGKLDRYWMRKA